MTGINKTLISTGKLALLMLVIFATTHNKAMAQDKKQIVRIAKITVDSTQIDSYRAAVKEIGEASLKNEPGVLMLFSVEDQKHPNQFTVMEVYADGVAYQAHTQTAHFKKYKETVKPMVKSLELIDVDPIVMGIKPALIKQ